MSMSHRETDSCKLASKVTKLQMVKNQRNQTANGYPSAL